MRLTVLVTLFSLFYTPCSSTAVVIFSDFSLESSVMAAWHQISTGYEKAACGFLSFYHGYRIPGWLWLLLICPKNSESSYRFTPQSRTSYIKLGLSVLLLHSLSSFLALLFEPRFASRIIE